MKKLFYIGLIGLAIFEIANVYFIMPMPGSQRINSIDFAYFLHSSRWVFRIIFAVMIIAGIRAAFSIRWKWVPFIALIPVLAIVYMFNFRMTADKMFLQPQHLILKAKDENKFPGNRLVIGIENNGEAKAYPIGFLAYHHQVLDTVGGKPVIVTYCSVCRTGRVYEPKVNGHYEIFRLVGMDHFNAMFEDKTTGSWWRQSNGEAITGKMKGQFLPEVFSTQMTIDKWFEIYPNGLVMQPDENFISIYDPEARYEEGKSSGSLTRTDSLSWQEKSWVVGIQIGKQSKAYDWKTLESKRIINDGIGQTNIVLALASDGKSFVAFERSADQIFIINEEDKLLNGNAAYNFSGAGVSPTTGKLKSIPAYQEFWHSWETFHPGTEKY